GKRNESRQKFLEKSIGEAEQERNIRTRPKTTQSLADIEAEAAARARGSASVVRESDPSLVASRESLTAERQQRAADRQSQEDEKDFAIDEAAKAAAQLDPTRPPGFGSARNPADKIKYENRVNFYLKQNKSPYSFRELEQ